MCARARVCVRVVHRVCVVYVVCVRACACETFRHFIWRKSWSAYVRIFRERDISPEACVGTLFFTLPRRSDTRERDTQLFTFSSTALLIQPMVAAMAGWYFFSEYLSFSQMIGMLIALVGIFLAKQTI